MGLALKDVAKVSICVVVAALLFYGLARLDLDLRSRRGAFPDAVPTHVWVPTALVVGINAGPGSHNEEDAEVWAKDFESRGYKVTRLYGKAATAEAIKKSFGDAVILVTPCGEVPKAEEDKK